MLTAELKTALRPSIKGVTLIIAVGNPLRHDDGAGPFIASRISEASDNLVIIDAGDKPENALFEAEKILPDKTIIIDAADFGAEPGCLRVIPEDIIPDTTLSTHTFPLSVITRMLREDCATSVVFVGIQCRDVTLGEGMCPEVISSCNDIISFYHKGD